MVTKARSLDPVLALTTYEETTSINPRLTYLWDQDEHAPDERKKLHTKRCFIDMRHTKTLFGIFDFSEGFCIYIGLVSC